MRTRVGQIEHQCGLRISAPRGRDTGSGAAERALAVGADHEPNTHFGIVKLDSDAGRIGLDRQRQLEQCVAV